MTVNQTTIESRERIRRYMIDELRAITLAWEIPGPPDTNVGFVQCWGVPASDGNSTRLVIVEAYKERAGFEVFAQIRPNSLDATTRVVKALDQLEDSQRG